MSSPGTCILAFSSREAGPALQFVLGPPDARDGFRRSFRLGISAASAWRPGPGPGFCRARGVAAGSQGISACLSREEDPSGGRWAIGCWVRKPAVPTGNMNLSLHNARVWRRGLRRSAARLPLGCGARPTEDIPMTETRARYSSGTRCTRLLSCRGAGKTRTSQASPVLIGFASSWLGTWVWWAWVVGHSLRCAIGMPELLILGPHSRGH